MVLDAGISGVYLFFSYYKDGGMKRFPITGMALLVMVSMFFVSCEQNAVSNESATNNESSEVDFTNHPPTTAAFNVRNETPFTLVAFRDSVNLANLLGGIPAGSQNHGIWRNPVLFNVAGGVAMVLVTYEQFLANKGNLSVLNNAPLTRMLVFHNHEQGNLMHYTISGVLGGLHRLVVNNPTSFNVDLRIGGIQGASLGFVPGAVQSATFYIIDGNINIFPVIRYFDPYRGTVVTFYPMASGQPVSFPFNVFDTVPQMLTLDLTPILGMLPDNFHGMTL